MQRYVLGFIFSRDLSKVYLIRKNHPEWQAGKLNGVGGKINPGESGMEAMGREAMEESGYTGLWTYYGYMAGDPDKWGRMSWEVKLFYSVMWPDQPEPETRETEPVVCIALEQLIGLRGDMIANLPWLITAALNHHTCPSDDFKLNVYYRDSL